MLLPTLKKKGGEKPTILLLSDDLRLHSGIGTMSREFVVGTADAFKWFQLGAAINHPEHGKVFDLSQSVNEEVGIDDASIFVMPWTGYGDPTILRKLMTEIKPDAVVHFTDPRFWGFLYEMSAEIRQQCPIIYYAIWDDVPYPNYNIQSYASCDMILGISKQSHNIHKHVLLNHEIPVIDLDQSTNL